MTAIEFAICLPVMLLMLMGIIEYSLIIYASTTMEGGLTYAAREGQTGYVNTGSAADASLTGICPPPQGQSQTDAGYITCVLDYYTHGLLNTSQITLAVCRYPGTINCSGINLGGAGSLVGYYAHYPWHISTPFLRYFFPSGDVDSNGNLTLYASAFIENETPSTNSDPSCANNDCSNGSTSLSQ